ncbi:hypothetical protein KAR91_44395 [Candidatus Pacearchaeota archaeon]|nr:hypothetical protein [Candidatus Pacearchaeota archaeon]
MIVPFKKEFADAVEDGSKGQTIRGAECYNKTCTYNGGDTPWCSLEKPDCFLSCSGYTPRYKVGDTLQLYTGLMQRKYCKAPEIECHEMDKDKTCNFEDYKIKTSKITCDNKGAKLLKETTCTESFPIKFEDLTEEIARQDGFKSYEVPSRAGECYCDIIPALKELKDFLINEYDAKDGDVFQVIRWK